MQVNVQKLSPVLVEFDVEIEVDRVRSEMNKAYQLLSKNAKVRGFRPGKAPRKVLAHMFGARVAADVAQRLVDDTFSQAVSDKNVQPVNQPAIEPKKLVDNKPFSYKARFEVIPEIESIDYDGFEIEKPKSEVTDAQIEEELDLLRRANSTLEPLSKPRGTKEGDVITIDFTVTVDGNVVEDAGATDFQAEVGAGVLMTEIEQAIVDKKAGETSEAKVELPAQHPHPGLAGKTATFVLTIKDVKERVLPDADDEFAKDLGDYDTLKDLEKSLSETVKKRLDEQAENTLAERIVIELVKKNPIDVPPSLVQRQMQVSERELLQQARQRGQQGQITPEIRQRIQQDAEVKVRAGLLMAEIAKKEGIKIGDPEIEEGLEELADQTGKNVAKLRAEYRDAQKKEMLVGMILENKVLDIIEGKSKISVEGEKPQKTTKKKAEAKGKPDDGEKAAKPEGKAKPKAKKAKKTKKEE